MRTEKEMPRTGELLAMLQEAINVDGRRLSNAVMRHRRVHVPGLG